MNQNAQDPVQAICSRLHPALPGLFFALLTLLFGFGLGIVFGANEDAIKSRLAASAAEVRENVYQGDEEQMAAVLGKSWTYMKRAHLHAGSLGGIAVALTLLIVLLNTPSAWTRVISLFLGIGGLGYSILWLWAGFRAPALGGTSAAKESLEWLAIPSSGAVVLATAAVTVLVVLAMIRSAARS
jgi:hypothetical protein